MARQEEIRGVIDDRKVRIVIESSTVLSSYKRVLYRKRAEAELEARFSETVSVSQQAALMAGIYTYPKLLSVTIEADGVDVENMTVEEFLALPTKLADEWLAASYRLNPEFKVALGDSSEATDEESAEAEKKGTESGEKPG